MAWVKGVSRKEQLAAMRGGAAGRVEMAKAMLKEGFSETVVRRTIREHLGVSAMTAYRDVRVALGGDRSEKRSSMILRGWPDPPPEEVFAAAICLADTDLEAIGWSPPGGVALAAMQLVAGTGTAFRALLSDEEARIAISRLPTRSGAGRKPEQHSSATPLRGAGSTVGGASSSLLWV